MRAWLVLAPALAAAAPVAAQSDEWRKSVDSAGELVFTSPDGGAELAVPKPVPLGNGKGLEALVAAEAASLERLGIVTKRGASERTTTREGVPVVMETRVIDRAGTRRLHAVVAGKFGQDAAGLCRLRVTIDSRTKATLERGFRLCFEMLEQARARLAGAPPGPDTPVNSSPNASARPQPSPRAGAGAIEAVFFWQSAPEYNGLSGMLEVDSDTFLFLKDGTVYRGFDAPPEDFDIVASRRATPHKWGSWRRSGTGFEVSWGPRGRKQHIAPGNGTKPCKPARAGETFDQAFRASSATSIGMGAGRSLIASQRFFRFHADGSFDLGSSTSFDTAGAVGHAGRGPRVGRYRLNGYLLELSYPGGRVERRSYCRVESGFILVNGVGMFKPD